MTTVLLVCQANLCRSAMGEWLARSVFERRPMPGAAVEIASAGTRAQGGGPMHPYAERVLREHAINPAGFRTRRLTEAAVRAADLVLTATRQQRSDCVALDPTAVRRTLTILQFGRYATALSPVAAAPPHALRLPELLDRLSVVRRELPVAPGADDDLADPVGLPVEDFRRCAAELRPVFDTLARLIVPIPPATPARHRIGADQDRPRRPRPH